MCFVPEPVESWEVKASLNIFLTFTAVFGAISLR